MNEPPAQHKELQQLSRDQLRDLARSRGLKGFGSLRKAELVRALAGNANSSPPASAHPPRAATPSVRVGPPRLRTDPTVRVDRIELEAVDPRWFRARWTLTPSALERATASMGAEWHRSLPALRIYRVACDDAGPRSKTLFDDMPVPADAVQWFINVPVPGGTWQVELGYLVRPNQFHTLIHSQPVTLPQSITTSDESGNDRPTTHREAARTPIDVTISAELVVAGTTLPGAVLTIDDQVVAVSSNGAFRWNTQLPDGRKVIPIQIECDDHSRQRILLAAERNTRFLEPEALEG